MKKHVSIAAALLFGAFGGGVTAETTPDLAEKAEGSRPPKGASFSEFSSWMNTAADDEIAEYMHSLSENYIKEHGEKANELRLCFNVDQNWMGMDHWVEQRWATVGVRFLDNARFDDFVVRRPSDKPWLIVFGYSPKHMGTSVQPMDNMMRNLGCLATVFKDHFNFGFMDFRASEKVFESYDVKLDYGKTTPAIIVFDQGWAYPAKAGSLSAPKLADFAQNYKDQEHCQNCPQRAKASLSEVGMYLEYAKNELSNNKQYIDSYNYLLDRYNNTWFHDDVMAPYFGPKVGRKVVGERLLFWIIVPLVLNSVFILYLLTGCLCRCLCGSKAPASQAKTPAKPTAVVEKEQAVKAAEPVAQKQQPAAAEKSTPKGGKGKNKKGKRDKID